MANDNELVRELTDKKYEYGFTTDIHTEVIERGLNEDVIRLISAKKGEPEWLLDFRLKAFRYWQTLEQPDWGHVNLPQIDYQAISYYADPTKKQKDEGNKEIDPELMKTFDKLGIPLEERMQLAGVAVDAVMDSVSVKTTFKDKLQEKGIIFSSISEAVRRKSRIGAQVPRLGGALSRQLLCSAQQCGVFRRFVCLHTTWRALPDGVVHLFPHQCTQHRTV